MKIIPKVISALFLISFLIATFWAPIVGAQSLSDSETESILKDTVWYDPSAGALNSSCDASGSSVSSTLPPDITSLIEKLKPAYIQAAQATNVPWQLIAGIHYRETSLAESGPNLFQITGYSGPTDLLSQAIAAGNFLQRNSVPSNLPNHRTPLQQSGNDPEEIKDTLYSYNGRAAVYAQQAQSLGFNSSTQPYEGSPYVMNNFDDIHRNMGIITTDGGGIDDTDTRLGAFTVFARLDGNSGGSGGCSGAVSGNLMQTILNYAWPDYHPAVYVEEKAAYKQAIFEARSRGEYTGGDYDADHIGIDCGAFVTRVMRDSGADPNYNSGKGNTIIQQAYLDANSQKYQKLAKVSSTADLQPGDIAINDVHTYIYVGKIQGFNGNSASASFSTTGLSWRAPMADNAYGFSDFTWYRLKSGV